MVTMGMMGRFTVEKETEIALVPRLPLVIRLVVALIMLLKNSFSRKSIDALHFKFDCL